MIDGHHTTLDWQKHSGRICVLPVGSFEQHSAHLPLETDILSAQYFARMVADDLGGALLPALPFGTCMEHNGFRGSVSLRPETLIQLIRDIVDEMEKQHFHVLILMNGHGGNFALGPMVRDINRADRMLKVLLFDWWDYLDGTITPQRPELGIDIHAGEMETSVMLALYPELVGDQRLEAPVKTEKEFPLTQRDLNTFGTGYFSPSGAIGYPSLASAEKGKDVIESVRAKMLPHLRDRLERLRTQPRYAGRGGIAMRNLTIDDLDAAMWLKTQPGWNQTEEDWRFILKNYDTDYFAAVHNGKVVGTAGAIRFGDALAWIGMVLVDPEFRRMGIARTLLQEVLDNLQECSSVKLDATALGLELYEQSGFVQEYSLHRLIHPLLPITVPPIDGEVLPMNEENFSEALVLDRQIFGADRSMLLRFLWENSPDAAYCARNQNGVSGFCLGRRGTNFYQIGPVAAADFESAHVLISHAMRTLAGRTVGLDVPESQSELIAWLQAIGFVTQRCFVRMARGEQSVLGVPEVQFAITGPEFG